MGVRVMRMIQQGKKSLLHRYSLRVSPDGAASVPKGHFAVYVGENQRRFVVPVSYLNHPSFQSLLNKAEDEFGLDQPTGGLRVPCKEEAFLALTSQLKCCSRD